MILQSRTGTSGAIFITKWGNFYKILSYKRQMKETGEIDFSNLLLYSPLICLATDTLPVRILKKLEFRYNKKEDEITTPSQAYTSLINLRNNSFRVVSCNENYFP